MRWIEWIEMKAQRRQIKKFWVYFVSKSSESYNCIFISIYYLPYLFLYSSTLHLYSFLTYLHSPQFLFHTSLFFPSPQLLIPLLLFCLILSIQVRLILHQKWEFALHPACEAKKSLNRLRAYKRASSDGCHRDAELAFLAHSNACWNRSSILFFSFTLFYSYFISFPFISFHFLSFPFLSFSFLLFHFCWIPTIFFNFVLISFVLLH